jgi:hypothetical protein
MLIEPQKTLEDIFAFLLNLKSIEGTIVQKRIEKMLDQKYGAKMYYKPQTVGLNKNINRWNKDQLENLKAVAPENLFFFGYANHDNNPTGFVDFENPADHYSSLHYGFKELNARMMDYITSPEYL